jgi:hypothetical protein
MKKIYLLTLVALLSTCKLAAQDTLWVKYDNRFLANKSFALQGVDSIDFKSSIVYFYGEQFPLKHKLYTYTSLVGDDLAATMQFSNPGRILYKPSTYQGVNYLSESSRWCLKHSMESEHFVVFWETGFGDDPTKSASYAFSPATLLANAEKIWNEYVDDLKFIHPGASTTDRYKIELYVFYQSDWKAEGSGVDNKIGLLNVNPWAISSRGGQTVAHEIGHTFQYLVSCDLGMQHGFNYGYGDNASGGNGWWESCANWQAYKCYPQMQFSDGENFEGHLKLHHLNLLHEDWRYQNCFIQDYWCMLYGHDFIGRLWRESQKPEDPVEAYKRLNNLTQQQFNDEQYMGFARMATWDIDGVRDLAKARIGEHQTHLHLAASADGTWEVDSAYCPQNYGYNIINMNDVAPGTLVKASFKGIAGAKGYRSVNVDKAGWRYGFVAYTKDEKRVYGTMCADKEGTAQLLVPDNCTRIFFIVMGAPTAHWRHPWDSNVTNDEQWPYQVKFENIDVYGTYGTYDDNYVRRDTTVTINAELARNTSSYTSVRVQYDMGAVSTALGLSTPEMKSVGRTAASNPRFVGISASGSVTTGTTTSTSSNTCYGHWFNASGNVCGYDGSAYIFAEFYPDSYGCYVGQYPGHLVAGKTYTIRQAIQYTHAGKQYTAKFIVNLKVK